MNERIDDTESLADEPRYSSADRRERNRYLREFLPAIGAYVLVLLVVLAVVDEDAGAARLLILIPLLPLVGVAVAVYRSVRRVDEYARLLQLQAMALGFVAMIFTALIFGFLGIVGITTDVAGWIVFGVGMTTWGVALGLMGGR